MVVAVRETTRMVIIRSVGKDAEEGRGREMEGEGERGGTHLLCTFELYQPRSSLL